MTTTASIVPYLDRAKIRAWTANQERVRAEYHARPDSVIREDAVVCSYCRPSDRRRPRCGRCTGQALRRIQRRYEMVACDCWLDGHFG